MFLFGITLSWGQQETQISGTLHLGKLEPYSLESDQRQIDISDAASPGIAQTGATLDGLAGLDRVRLSDMSRKLLGKNGFVVKPTDEADLPDIYKDAKRRGQGDRKSVV